MRGLFSAGVMDVLMENEIWPDGVIGVSAGAAFGCNMKSKQPGRAIRYNKKLVNDWRYASLRSLLTTGDYFGGEYAYHYMPRHIDYLMLIPSVITLWSSGLYVRMSVRVRLNTIV